MLMLVLAGILAVQDVPTAAEQRLSATYTSCMDQSGGVTADMLDCIGVEYDRQDAALNATYRSLMAGSSASERAELRDAQRAWIRAKEARCASEWADAGGGTLSSVVANECYLLQTVERLLWLEDRANN